MSQIHLMDNRLIEFAYTSLGQELQVKLSNENKAKGIFYTLNPQDQSLILRNHKRYDDQGKLKSIDEIHHLETDDFVYILASNLSHPNSTVNIEKVVSQNRATNRIKMDNEITKKKVQKDRNLVRYFCELMSRWEINEPITEDFDMDNADQQVSWDQFKVNNEQFGIDFDYSDDKYTTALNIDKVDKDLRKKAERIENELKSQKIDGMLRHVAEDRGLLQVNEMEDEEEVYSAVIGSGAYQEKKEVLIDDAEFKSKFTGQPRQFINKNKINIINIVQEEVLEKQQEEEVVQNIMEKQKEIVQEKTTQLTQQADEIVEERQVKPKKSLKVQSTEYQQKTDSIQKQDQEKFQPQLQSLSTENSSFSEQLVKNIETQDSGDLSAKKPQWMKKSLKSKYGNGNINKIQPQEVTQPQQYPQQQVQNNFLPPLNGQQQIGQGMHQQNMYQFNHMGYQIPFAQVPMQYPMNQYNNPGFQSPNAGFSNNFNKH